ncbi:MAG: xanthine/uracil permease [Candidatus Tyloplasma litorale]|nr:MAG: xanthine/uracil permease [Mycoplasmatales bacterium]
MNKLNSYFKISERGSTFSREIIAGIIVFISMFYIIVVQGDIIGDGLAAESGMDPIVAAATIGIVTALSAAIASILLGCYANLPLSLASGMGVNAFISYTLIAGGMSFSAALSAVLISGLIFILVSVTSIRSKILNSIPEEIRKAISIGVGFFLMYVAFTNTGIIGWGDPNSTATFLGDLSNPVILLSFISIFATIVLWLLDVKGGTLIAMIITILIGFIFMAITNSSSWGDDNDLSSLPSLNMDWSVYGESFRGLNNVFGTSFKEFQNVDDTWKNPNWYLAIFILFLNDFFDTAGVVFGVTKLMQKDFEVDEKSSKRVLVVDALATTFGSMLGATNVTVYAESNAGIQYGGRTGLTAITTGILFLVAIPIIPLLAPLFTSSITVGAIVLVGIMMSSTLKDLRADDKVYFASSIFTIIFMMLSYSIGTGIVIGLLTFIILMLITGRYKELDWVLLASSPMFLIFLILPMLI